LSLTIHNHAIKLHLTKAVRQRTLTVPRLDTQNNNYANPMCMCLCVCVRACVQTDETTDRHPQHVTFPLKMACNTEHTVSDL